MENVCLIVGLGNPGGEHSATRHNAGFMLVDRLAQGWQAHWRSETRFQGELARVDVEGQRVLLCKPLTYMNRSGDCVGAVGEYYRVEHSKTLVVVDDADLPLGEIRLRPGGGPGGHHGLESVQQRLGSQEYPRLRIGIGRQNARREITGHVLGRFESTETALLNKVLERAGDQVKAWLRSGIQKAMSQFNGVVEDPENLGKDK